MFFSIQTILSFLTHYGYALLIPLAIVEGPTVTLLASFMASMGVFNVFIVYGIGAFGDFFGDTLWYWASRSGRNKFLSFAKKYGGHLGITDNTVEVAEKRLKNNLYKTVIVGKVTDVFMVPIVIASGLLKVEYRRFIVAATSIDLIKNLIIVLIGYYFGKSFVAINSGIHKFFLATSIIVALVIIVYLSSNYAKQYFSKKN